MNFSPLFETAQGEGGSENETNLRQWVEALKVGSGRRMKIKT